MDALNDRYIRNIPSVSSEEQEKLFSSRVTVMGCGGLGGHVIDSLTRIGVGHLNLVDGDNFSTSNLNRQLISDMNNLYKAKASEAAAFVNRINPQIECTTHCLTADSSNMIELVSGSDVVIDAFDNISARLILQDACRQLLIPLVHGAVGGWRSQVATVLPGSDLLSRIYPVSSESSSPLSVLPCTVAFTAALQVSEAIKLIVGREPSFAGKLFIADLSTGSFNTVEL